MSGSLARLTDVVRCGASAALRRRVVQGSAWLLFVAVASNEAPAQRLDLQFERPPTVAVPSASRVFDLNGDGPFAFTRVVGMVALSDGTIVVFDAGSNELRAFTSAGEHKWSAGRRGTGPGEFQMLAGGAVLSADTIVALDRLARRLAVFSASGKHIRTFVIRPPPLVNGSPTFVSSLAGDRMLLGFSAVYTAEPRVVASEFSQYVYVYLSDGAPIDGQTGVLAHESDHFVQAVPMEMGGVAYWDLAFGRRGSVRGFGRSFVAADGGTWAVVERSLAGDTLRRYSINRQPQPVTRADIAAYERRARESARPSRADVVERMLKGMPYPKAFPAIARIEVDDQRRLWLLAYSPADPVQSWTVIDLQARSAAELRFPSGFRAMTFDRNHAAGVWVDADGLEHIQAFDITALMSRR